jgi:hypothetical protein
MKTALVINMCARSKIVMNLVLICVLINKALNVSVNMEVKVVEAQ